jgi:SAM-dependent methyltransferase
VHRLTRKALKIVHRTIGSMLPADALTMTFPEIPGRIHVNDLMLRSSAPADVAHYRSDALSGLENLEASLRMTNRSWCDVRSLLDFPSGYGRLTRWLVTRVDCQRVTAGDVDPEAVRFCATEFGVRPLHAARNVLAQAFPDSYDLIFVGSLLTHLPPSQCRDTLAALIAVLQPGGQIVFTTQGESCLVHLDWYGDHFRHAAGLYRRQIAERGIAFVPYPRSRDYGITIHAGSYVETLMRTSFPDLTLVRREERGWDNHQDVWSYCLAPPRGAPAPVE